jgi:hypothetical protein
LHLRAVPPDAVVIHKAGNQAAASKRENFMNRLLTIAELQRRNASELHVLFRQANQALARTRAGTAERRNNLASIENIARAMARGPGVRGF